LYNYLIEHAIGTILVDFNNKIDNDETDFFRKLKNMMKYKVEILNEYPAIFKFLETAYLDSSSEAKEIMEDKIDEIIKSSLNLFANIDTTKFREGIDLQITINTVLWSLEGYSNTEIKKSKLVQAEINYDKIFEGIDVYLEFFKKIFYK